MQLYGWRWWVLRACCLVYHQPLAVRRRWTGDVNTRMRTRGMNWAPVIRPDLTRTCCRPRTPVWLSAWPSTAGRPRSEPAVSGRQWKNAKTCVNWRKSWRKKTRCLCSQRHALYGSVETSWLHRLPTKVAVTVDLLINPTVTFFRHLHKNNLQYRRKTWWRRRRWW